MSAVSGLGGLCGRFDNRHDFQTAISQSRIVGADCCQPPLFCVAESATVRFGELLHHHAIDQRFLPDVQRTGENVGLDNSRVLSAAHSFFCL